MPGRHVHFSTESTFYSPRPELSSLPLSDPSYPPSPYNHHGNVAYAPPRRAYTVSASPARANPLLAHSDAPLLNYDISFPPSTITTTFPGLTTSALKEPAVYPAQRAIALTTPHLPWSVPVVAANGAYVTVSDVLGALHAALRARVTPAEFSALGSRKLMRRATDAYTRRYMRLKGHRGYAEEKAGGVHRVDFLMGCTKFKGLSATGTPDVWRLHVA
ncbi:hypothetical protein GGX14DRAFT_409587 [Mycena pura]|uniref:DUF6699 domain-containing protein n=1 Tax=Mycena pura TaxID=153505 RepID=A0AAD7E5E7_9AGAR|nr:hypothetical protein GGX14DRAFT_409587 [Mycena pura]